MPATLSILTNVFTIVSEHAKAIAMWSAIAGLGVAIGPTLGGWLLEHFDWGSIFMVNLPIVAVALIAGRMLVPPSADPHPRALDPIGARCRSRESPPSSMPLSRRPRTDG